MKSDKLAIFGILAGLVSAVSTNAKDITIFDNHVGNNYGTDSRPGVREDNEVEPGTVTGQAWDLEAFYLEGTKLSMIGGFNFLAGEGTYASGDIFIDVDGNAKYGSATVLQTTGTQVVSNNFGYDYVISFGGRVLDGFNDSTDQTLDGSFKVYSLSGASTVTVSSIGQSNPWTYSSGGTDLNKNGTVTQTDLGSANYNGLTGGTHYKFGEIDLSTFLTADQIKGALFHFTMECGNDNLIGRVPDGGATVLLMGAGLTALGLVRRRISR